MPAGAPREPEGMVWLADSKLWTARPSCLRLFWHWARAAASRTFWTAGSKRPMRMAMMAITTNNSISVNARFVPCHNLHAVIMGVSAFIGYVRDETSNTSRGQRLLARRRFTPIKNNPYGRQCGRPAQSFVIWNVAVRRINGEIKNEVKRFFESRQAIYRANNCRGPLWS